MADDNVTLRSSIMCIEIMCIERKNNILKKTFITHVVKNTKRVDKHNN